MLFHTPRLRSDEKAVITRVQELRQVLRHHVTEERRWMGQLRRISLARAIHASNTIEGYDVSLDEAMAAAGDEEALDPETEAWAALTGYRDAMTYVLQLADDPHFQFDGSLIRSLHFMMLRYDMSVGPGRWRPTPTHVLDERTQEIVYIAPDAVDVPALMEEIVEYVSREDDATPPIVRAAMAHLNLVMVHPFRDGNGRMARCIQTLVLAREGILAAPFSSIEEYLGRNTDDYYDVLAKVGGGRWQPERDARPWIRFALTAHYRQATTLLVRTSEAARRWELLSEEVARKRLPERAVGPLFEAALGFRLRNSRYREIADVGAVVAGRNLRDIANAGLLVARGAGGGRYYIAAERLERIERTVREDRPPRMPDPFEEQKSAQQPMFASMREPSQS